jgi:hypothetical protein
MKPIIMAYPYLHSLPRGVRMMLVTSESYLFDRANLPGNNGQQLALEAIGLQTGQFTKIQPVQYWI